METNGNAAVCSEKVRPPSAAAFGSAACLVQDQETEQHATQDVVEAASLPRLDIAAVLHRLDRNLFY